MWFLVLGAISVLTIVMCLPRHERAREVGEGREPVDNLEGDRVADDDGLRAKRVALQPRFSAREPSYGGRTLSDWLTDSLSTNDEVVVPAAKVLYELGPDASPLIPQLSMLLTSSNDCNRAVRLLVNIGTNSLPVLLDALAHNNTARLDVAGMIGQLGDAARDAIPMLIQCLNDSDPGVHGNAMGSLGNIRTRPDIAVPALVNSLADPENMIRAGAAATLSRYGGNAASAVPALVSVAREDPDEQVRREAVEAVCVIAPEQANP